MKAVIMAGGEGTRLRPLTCNKPKPMLPMLDKPVMLYAIELLKKYGITDILVTLQYLPDEVMSYFGDGKEFGVGIRYFLEDVPLGTAGSVKNAEDYLDETFIVLSGDALTDIDLSKVLEYHKNKKSIATLVLKEVPFPLEYGVVVTDKEGQVAGFLEKPSWGEVFSDKVNTGIYVLEPEVFNYFERNQKFDFSNDLFPVLLNNNKAMYGYVSDGYWCDIGNVEQYMRCHHDILRSIVKVSVRGQEYRDGIWIGENCEISPFSKITAPVFIGNNCRVYDNAEIGPYSVLGKNNIVSNGSSIRRSILFDNCYIGASNEIKGAILCSKVQLESRASVFEECAIGDETLVGERVIIKPGVKVWPNKVIESGAIVKSNIIWGGKLSRSLFGKGGISGEVNVDITPEFVSKIGSAYGAILKPESKVAISCSDNGAAQMFKYSLATGLLSLGIEVYDLKRMTTAMARHAALFFGVHGAIHVTIDHDNSQKVNIIFMDEHGMNIDRSMERKIEGSFVREDFRRVKTDAFKQITHMNDCIEYYNRQLVNQLAVHRIRNQKFKVILSLNNNMLLSVVERIFSELGINVKLYHEYKDLKGLRQEVIDSGANLGIFISKEGEEAILVDDRGNFVRDELFDVLNALVILKSTKLSTLTVPVTASCSLEYVANICGAKFIRTKTSQRSILDSYLKNERRLSRREVINAYLMSLDTVSVVMLTLNLMASSNLPLSRIMGEVPRFHSSRAEVNCPWNMKGMVMRTLIEDNNSNSVDLIEGVKLNFQDSWALIIPDSDEPICRIYTESAAVEEAARLRDDLSKKIETLIRDTQLFRE